MDIWSIAQFRRHLEAIDAPKLASIVVSEDPLFDFASSTSSYPTLLDRAAQLAWHLSFNLGLSKGDRVALMMRNEQEVIELHFAAAAMHLILVNINTSLVAAELAYILDDSMPKVIFAVREFSSVIQSAIEGCVEAEIEHIIWSGSHGTPQGSSRGSSSMKRLTALNHRYSDSFTRLQFRFVSFEIWRERISEHQRFTPSDPFRELICPINHHPSLILLQY